MNKPSVSDLCGLLNKPGLLSWANKQGLQGKNIAKVRADKCRAGTDIHWQIEQAFSGKNEFSDPLHLEAFTAFMQNKSLFDYEKEIETEWFVGRYDAHLEIDGDEYIVDFKRGFKGKVYLEHILQLVAYTMAVPAKMALVGVPAFALKEVIVADRSKYEEIIKNLSAVWCLLEETKNDRLSGL
jgi:hypothetical protein